MWWRDGRADEPKAGGDRRVAAMDSDGFASRLRRAMVWRSGCADTDVGLCFARQGGG